MAIGFRTKHGIEYEVFSDKRSAAAWCCEDEDPESPNFWLDDAGNLQSTDRMIDYSVSVYGSLADAASEIETLDPDAAAASLRKLADAYDRWNERELS